MTTEFDAYVCWVSVLMRTPHDRWTDAVKRDFEGVQLLKNGSDAMQFVMSKRHDLFDGPIPGRVRPRTYRAGDEENDKLLVVTIDPATADQYITERLEALIERKREELGIVRAAGRPEFVAREGKYRLSGKVDVQAVLIAIEVLDELKRHKAMSYAEVGEWIAKRHPLALKQKSMSKGSERTKAMSALGSRYVKKGIQMMEAVAQGRFPK